MPARSHLVRLMFLALASGALAAACSGGGGDEPAGGTGGAGADDAPARVILGGALVDPPYEVEVDGFEVVVNGTVVASFADRAPAQPEAVDASGTLDIFGLVELARLAYVEAGSDAAALDAALAALDGRTEVTSASVSEVDGIPQLDVTDTTGATASFVPTSPDNEMRQASDSEREDAAGEFAAVVEDHLASGGGLVVSASLHSLVPAGAVEDLLAETDAAVRLGGEQSRTALLALYDDETTVDEILEHYEPRATSARTTPARLLAAAISAPSHPIALNGDGARLAAATAAFQSTEPAKTPGSKKAWVLQTLYATDQRGFIEALVREGYEVRSYNFYSQVQPPGSGWSAFLTTSRSGAVYFATHSGATGLSLQSFATRDAANTAAGHLAAQITARDLGWWQEADGTWWLKVTPQGIRNHWDSDNTIVHSASCHSITLAAAFDAREFAGYEPTTTCAIAAPDTNRLWRRLSGIDGDGALREMSAAVGAGGFSGGFRYRDGSPEGGTVIAPSVAGTAPTEPVVVGGQTFLLVLFDADMHVGTPPPTVLDITGCLRPIDQGQWPFANTLTIGVEATEPGEAQVRVRASNAQSDRGQLNLNGNQTPEGKNAVAPNRDDYLFTVTCVGSAVATPTPTTGVQPPADPTPAGVVLPDVGPLGETFWLEPPPGATVPEGYVQIDVLLFQNEHYPLSQFTLAQPDNCPDLHYHAAIGISLEGSSTPDPNQSGCGFGSVKEPIFYSVIVPDSVADMLPFAP